MEKEKEKTRKKEATAAKREIQIILSFSPNAWLFERNEICLLKIIYKLQHMLQLGFAVFC
jgi:hypothetical protein